MGEFLYATLVLKHSVPGAQEGKYLLARHYPIQTPFSTHRNRPQLIFGPFYALLINITWLVSTYGFSYPFDLFKIITNSS